MCALCIAVAYLCVAHSVCVWFAVSYLCVSVCVCAVLECVHGGPLWRMCMGVAYLSVACVYGMCMSYMWVSVCVCTRLGIFACEPVCVYVRRWVRMRFAYKFKGRM